jgi:hypothetical protein
MFAASAGAPESGLLELVLYTGTDAHAASPGHRTNLKTPHWLIMEAHTSERRELESSVAHSGEKAASLQSR